MALSVSEQRQREKKKKFEKQIRRILGSASKKELKDYLVSCFGKNVFPTPDQFTKILSASKFGGSNDLANSKLGMEFAFATLNQVLSNIKEMPDDFVREHIHFATAIAAPTGHQYFELLLLGKIAKYVEKLDLNDFRVAKEISPNLLLEKNTNAYGCLFLAPNMTTIPEIEEHAKDIRRKRFLWSERQPLSVQLTPDFSTGALEYVAPFVFWFGTIDELVDLIPKREEIDVSSHLRHYQSGKVVRVKLFSKRKPIRHRTETDLITNHIVYKVYDHAEKLRYIGEGKPNRHEHVNSGASHNRKINEHYFLKGEMRVEQIAEGLTKSEALAIERLLLNQSREHDLWNVKDYEPFSNNDDKGLTDNEVLEMLSDRERN